MHAWDLARAAGGDERLDPARVRRALAAEAFAAGLLATGAFEPPVPAPEGADARARLLALTGRRIG